MLLETIKRAARRFDSAEGKIKIFSHYDTDGITSAAILCKTLQRKDKNFSIEIVKQTNRKMISELSSISAEIIFFLDLSTDFEELKRLNKEIFILDHHEVIIKGEIPENISFMNPLIDEEEKLSASCITYLFSKEVDEQNKDLANLAVLGLVGDIMDRNIGRIGNLIIKDADITVKKSLLLFPSTRPLNKALEFSSIYIPGVTGSSIGALNLLREAGIKLKEGEKFKTVLDLNNEELQKLVTLITLRKADLSRIIGNIFLIKFFNKLEDARELSAVVNACGRLGYGDVALAFCMENKKVLSNVNSIYSRYKHDLINGLNWISLNEKIEGDNYIIINGKNFIKDSLIGTLMSILALSFVYPTGTVIIGMAYSDGGKIKVSARAVGDNSEINLRKALESVVNITDGECGGHNNAAGCFIPLSQEANFINLLQKELSMQGLKIKIQ
jgi:RecJ-like exonuclease